MKLKNVAYTIILGLCFLFPNKSFGEDHWQKYFSQKLALLEKEEQRKENLETLFLKSQVLISDMYLYFLTQKEAMLSGFPLVPSAVGGNDKMESEIQNVFSHLKNFSIHLENKLPLSEKNKTSQSLIENIAVLNILKKEILPRNFHNTSNIILSLSAHLYYDVEIVKHKLLIFFLPFSSQEQTLRTYVDNYLVTKKQDFEEGLFQKQENNLPLLLKELSKLQKAFKNSKGNLSLYTNRVEEFLFLYDEMMNFSEELVSFYRLYQNKKSLLFLFQALKGELQLLLTSNYLTGNIFPFIYKSKELKITYFGLMNLQERLKKTVSETALLYKNNENILKTLVEEKELRNIAFLITQLEIISHIYWPDIFASILRKPLFQEPFFQFERMDPDLHR